MTLASHWTCWLRILYSECFGYDLFCLGKKTPESSVDHDLFLKRGILYKKALKSNGVPLKVKGVTVCCERVWEACAERRDLLLESPCVVHVIVSHKARREMLFVLN